MKIKRIIPIFAVMYILMYAPSFVVAEDALVAKISERLKEFGAESAGVYFEGFDHRMFTHHPDDIYHAASTMKVPVMMEVFRQVERGKLKLEQGVKVENRFASIIDGSPFSLTQEDDSDKEIYAKIGQTLPLQELVQRMINRSSNLSTNLVIQLVSAKNVMQLMSEIGAKDMTVLRGVEDTKAYEAGKNNTTSARALTICLKSILDPKRFSDSSRRQMIEILLSQTSRGGIPAGVDRVEPGLKIACKDGWITEINHDSAIIQNQKGESAILVILTKGAKTEETGVKLVATLAADIWSAMNRPKSARLND
jgi:beta-lactamase class A